MLFLNKALKGRMILRECERIGFKLFEKKNLTSDIFMKINRIGDSEKKP